ERTRFHMEWNGPMSPEGLGTCLLSSPKGWEAVVAFATSVVNQLTHTRKEEERRRRDRSIIHR
ncbi:hypothetical protein KM043_000065, partial [Ampulex compressa]